MRYIQELRDTARAVRSKVESVHETEYFPFRVRTASPGVSNFVCNSGVLANVTGHAESPGEHSYGRLLGLSELQESRRAVKNLAGAELDLIGGSRSLSLQHFGDS